MTLSPRPAAEAADLTELLGSAQCVMFDFDGPLAALFAGLSAPEVARTIRARIASWQAPSFTRDFTRADDPHQVLLDVAAVYTGPEYGYRVAELDKLLTEREVAAAATAVPTPHSDGLVRSLAAAGKAIAVTTNNAAAAASAYLERRGLSGLFAEHVYGRPEDPRRMKPQPHCLSEALAGLGKRPGVSMMIGDSPSDFAAADALGVAFLGYARDDRKRRMLEAAGARRIVGSLRTLQEAVTA